MVKLRRKARETARHERAVVYQELGDRAAADPDQIERQKKVAEKLRLDARRRLDQ